MAPNSLYPGFVKVYYTSNGHTHTHTVPVQVYSGVGGVWFLSEKASTVGRAWTVSFPEYVTVFRAMLPASASVNFAELWTMDSPTADPIFREAITISLAGTRSGTTQPNQQETVIFRSQNGGLWRWVGLETSAAANTVTQPSAFAAPYTTLRDYVQGSTSVISARDGGYLIAPLRAITKTNDKLRERFLLDA
jgi:hypothetical protein